MKGKSIGLIIAMPEEVRPIAQRLGRYRKERIDRFPFYRFRLEGREIDLVQSGMGRERAAAAAAALIAAHRPGLLISAGLGGGVRKGLATGDVVLAGKVMSLSEEKIADTIAVDNAHLLRDLAESLPLRDFRILDGCIITSQGILRKKEVNRILPVGLGNPVLDMETSAVAEAAFREAVPFLALRAISDAEDEEILFSIEEITDQDLNISIRKVLSAMLRNPRLLPQMLRLARNAKMAGNNLALVLERVIRIL
jgi:adenosylhomocysteine nucleosidase